MRIVFHEYFLHLFLVGLITWVAWIPANVPFWHNMSAGMVALNIFAAAYGILVVPVINYGAQHAYLRYMRDERVDIRDVFSGFKTNYLNIVLAKMIVFAI